MFEFLKGKKLEDLKVPELKQKANSLGIKGADGMKKSELILALEAHQNHGAGQAGSEVSNQPVPAVVEKNQSSSETSDYANHPKFAKFKSQGEK